MLGAASDHDDRREFAQLVEANKVAQLPESEFEVDPGLRDIIEAQIRQEEEAVRHVSNSPALMLSMLAAAGFLAGHTVT